MYVCMYVCMYVWRFNTKTKNFSSLIRELLYADDADFVSHSEEDLQEIMNLFSTACDAFGLTISIKKTKVMFTPVPGAPYVEPDIFVKRKRGLRLWTPLCNKLSKTTWQVN